VRPFVLLLQPGVGDMDDFRDRPTPPVSLLAAATLVARDCEVQIVDQRLLPDWRERIRDALSRQPVVVGVTTLPGPMIRNALEMVAEVRAHSRTPVVWGGTHVSLIPEQAIRSPAVDYVVVGEGEVAFASLVDHLSRGRQPRDVPGVWGKDPDGSVYQGPPSPVLAFDRLPLPPYHLVPMEDYLYSHRGTRRLDYLSSRGCPHTCSYCYNNVFYRNAWTPRPAHQVLEEIARLRERYAFDTVYFLDDNFFVDVARGWRIGLGLRDMGIGYETQGVDIQTVAAMSDRDLDRLEASGLGKLTIGVESACDRTRRLIRKWGDRRAVLATLRRLAGRSFLVLTSFIIGFPFETWEEIQETIDFALELQSLGRNFRFPQLYNYIPLPGTPLARALEQAGFHFPESLEAWAEIDWDRSALFRENPQKLDRLASIAFLSKFVDRKFEDYGARPGVAALYRLYRPVACARLRHGWTDWVPERRAYAVVKRLAARRRGR